MCFRVGWVYWSILSGGRLRQVMDDRWDDEIKEYGAVNVTGFRLVDTSRPAVRQFLRQWEKLDPNVWPGAGKPYIRVQYLFLHLPLPSRLFL